MSNDKIELFVDDLSLETLRSIVNDLKPYVHLVRCRDVYFAVYKAIRERRQG